MQLSLASINSVRSGIIEGMSEETFSIPFEDLLESLPGRILPKRYRIDTLLSVSPHSAIFRTFYEPLDQTVALRLFKVRTHEGDYQYKRFLQEAKRLAAIKHPNIIKIVDYGILEEGYPFIVTDFVKGPTLEEVLNSTNRIDADQVVILFSQIAKAVQHGHENGATHETLKPSRIILFDDPETNNVVVKVTGFGLFAFHHKLGWVLKTPMERQELIGTPAYMSPEQCLEDKVIDGRSDVYSLGCMMYECLGGEPPFISNDPKDTLKKQVSQPHVPLNVLRKDIVIPKRLQSIVDKCLEKDHIRRYQFMRDLQADLELDVDPAEREKQIQIPEAITKAQLRVKESFEVPVKQLALLFGGLLTIGIVGFMLINGANVASQFADMGIWKSKLESGKKALTEGRIEEAGRDLEQSVVEAKKFKAPDLRMAMSLNEESEYFLTIGKYAFATKALSEALSVEQALQNSTTQVAGQSYYLLSRAQLGAGALAPAEKAAKSAIEIFEKTAGENKMALFDAYYQLVRIYAAEKKMAEAKGVLEKMKATLPAQASAEASTNLKQAAAIIDHAGGKFGNAEKTLQEVLGERQEKIGLSSPAVVDTMVHLGNVLAAQKKYEKSLSILKAAYESKQKFQPEESPAMIALYYQIGEIYEKAGNKSEAEKHYRTALEQSEKIWGARNKERLQFIDSFAAFLRRTGRISAAEVYEQEAREIRDPSKIIKVGH